MASSRFHLYLPDAERAEIERWATLEGLSIAGFLRTAAQARCRDLKSSSEDPPRKLAWIEDHPRRAAMESLVRNAVTAALALPGGEKPGAGEPCPGIPWVPGGEPLAAGELYLLILETGGVMLARWRPELLRWQEASGHAEATLRHAMVAYHAAVAPPLRLLDLGAETDATNLRQRERIP